MNLAFASMKLRKLFMIFFFLAFQSCVYFININNPFSGDRKECGSYEAIEHLTGAHDRIRNNASPLKDIGGMAALHNSATNFGSSSVTCGASLISDRYLLTAAHCISESNRPVSISLGREDLDEHASPSNIYGIKDVIIHPQYKSVTRGKQDYNDIAILKTDRKVLFSPKAWPFCLPDSSNMVLEDYESVEIAGWGHVNQSHTASKLQIAFVKIVENTRCTTEWRLNAPHHYDNLIKFSYPQGLTNEILCAGRKGVDACNGDSGGPMTHQNNEGEYILYGLIAKGIPCGDFPILPGFYTNIARYIDWIYAKTGLRQPQVHSNTPLSNHPLRPGSAFPPRLLSHPLPSRQPDDIFSSSVVFPDDEFGIPLAVINPVAELNPGPVEGANPDFPELISFGVTKPGQCPPSNRSCTPNFGFHPNHNFGSSDTCSGHIACPKSDKCCFDACLEKYTCKTPLTNVASKPGSVFSPAVDLTPSLELISHGVTKPGQCPPAIRSCPFNSNFGSTRTCSGHIACPGSDKCCFDACQQKYTCKSPVTKATVTNGFDNRDLGSVFSVVVEETPSLELISGGVTKPGQCPSAIDSCPFNSNFRSTRTCTGHLACPRSDKCCFDSCLQKYTCKTPNF